MPHRCHLSGVDATGPIANGRVTTAEMGRDSTELCLGATTIGPNSSPNSNFPQKVQRGPDGQVLHHAIQKPNNSTNSSAARNPLSSSPPRSSVRGIAPVYSPLRLDSQLLAIPVGNASVLSPTRRQLPTYWSTSGALPYPAGSPMAYSSGLCIVSPATQSLRMPFGNDGTSPMQPSISAIGCDNSVVATSFSCISPSVGMINNPNILDAPQQLSLVPPPHFEERPLFTFGDTILHSAVYTPTAASPAFRRPSVYRDAIHDLSRKLSDADNQLPQGVYLNNINYGKPSNNSSPPPSTQFEPLGTFTSQHTARPITHCFLTPVDADTSDGSLHVLDLTDAGRPVALDHTARPDNTTNLLAMSVSTNVHTDPTNPSNSTTPSAATVGRRVGIDHRNVLANKARRSSLKNGAIPIQQALGTMEHYPCMPSPDDPSGHIFGGLRDIGVRNSPSDQSTSAVSLFPGFGLRQPSPLPPLSPANGTPSQLTLTALQDLDEALRLLQSDIQNVYCTLPATDHALRRCTNSCLVSLLQLMADILHSINISSTEAELQEDLGRSYEALSTFATTQMKSCGEAVQRALQAIRRDQTAVEPLLFTVMLTHSATLAVLQQTDKLQAAKAPNRTSFSFTGPSGTRVANYPSNYVAVLGEDDLADLAGNDELRELLNRTWPELTRNYTRQLWEYMFLRVTYVQLNGVQETTTSPCSTEREEATGAPGKAKLRAICEEYIRLREEEWQQNHDASLRNLHQSFPLFEEVVEKFSNFREGECWEWWYETLGEVMSTNFDTRETSSLFQEVKANLQDQNHASTKALASVTASHEVTIEDIEEALETAEAELALLEEQSKSYCTQIMQLMLRRIIVLAIWTSAAKANRDTSFTTQMFSANMFHQRKSLEVVEQQLSLMHQEADQHIKVINSFLHLLEVDPVNVVVSPAMDTMQWNSPNIRALSSLLVTANDIIGGDVLSFNKTQEYVPELDSEPIEAALESIHNVVKRMKEAVFDLCDLLQSSGGSQEGKETMPVNGKKTASSTPSPSMRALCRLFTATREAQQSIIMNAAAFRQNGELP